MIAFFGPTGSGKSMQGQLMAVRHGWRWLSAGQLLRDTSDPEIYKYLKNGELVPNEYTMRLMTNAIEKAKTRDEIERVILDGFPRALDQAKLFISHNQEKFNNPNIALAVVFDVSEVELKKRLKLRGRMEDDPLTIDRRIAQYNNYTQPILDYLERLEIPVVHIDGTGTVGEVHDRLEAVLEKYNITGAF